MYKITRECQENFVVHGLFCCDGVCTVKSIYKSRSPNGLACPVSFLKITGDILSFYPPAECRVLTTNDHRDFEYIHTFDVCVVYIVIELLNNNIINNKNNNKMKNNKDDDDDYVDVFFISFWGGACFSYTNVTTTFFFFDEKINKFIGERKWKKKAASW